MKKSIIFLLLLKINFLFGQEIWSLEKCVEHAINNNIQIKQRHLNTDLAKIDYRQSIASVFPSLNADASQSYNTGRSIDPTTNLFLEQQIKANTFSLSSNILLFGGFRRYNSIQQSKYDLKANETDAEQTQNDIILNITTSYLQILLNEEQLVLAKNQLDVSNAQVEQTKKLVEVGSVPMGNLLEMQSQQAMDELSLVNAQNQLDISYLNLILFLDLDPNKKFEIEKPLLEIPMENMETLDAENIYQNSLTTQPQIKSAAFRMKSAEKSNHIALGSLLPTISMFSTLRTNYSDAQLRAEGFTILEKPIIGITAGNENVFSIFDQQIPTGFSKIPFRDQLDQNLSRAVGISLSIPLFNGWQNKSAVSRSKINVLNAKYNSDQTKYQLKRDVTQAVANAKAASTRYKSAVKNSEAMKKSFEYIQQRYDVGLVNSLDYITTKNNLIRAESDVIQAKYDYIFRVKILDFYQGKSLKF